ncbi:MAG: thioredoxin family protein [Candidatus Nanohaloarchaea archaeon]
MKEVTVEVFYSRTCPNCPPQKELVKELGEREDVKPRLTDVAVKNGRAEEHGVRAVPTTVVDGPALDSKTGFRGITSKERLETAIEVAKGEKDREALSNPGLVDRLKNIF